MSNPYSPPEAGVDERATNVRAPIVLLAANWIALGIAAVAAAEYVLAHASSEHLDAIRGTIHLLMLLPFVSALISLRKPESDTRYMARVGTNVIAMLYFLGVAGFDAWHSVWATAIAVSPFVLVVAINIFAVSSRSAASVPRRRIDPT